MFVKIAHTIKEKEEHFQVRKEVFVKEQNIDPLIEFDGLDDQAVLFTCYIGEVPVGAARLIHQKVGRVSTLKEYRKQGIGGCLMRFIEDHARASGLEELRLHAQMSAKDFYLHLGYEPVGEIFQEADIDHIKMIKKIKAQ